MTILIHRPTRSLLVGAGALALAPLLVACAGEDSLGKKAAVAVGAATKTVEPADFVKQSRAGETDYMPVGVPPAERPSAPKAAAAVKATEKTLDATRTETEAAGAEAQEAAATPTPTPPTLPAR